MTVLSILQQAYVPILYEDLIGHPGPIGRLPNPKGPRRGKVQSPFSATNPKPMAFELRAQSRPKTIMRVSLPYPLSALLQSLQAQGCITCTLCSAECLYAAAVLCAHQL